MSIRLAVSREDIDHVYDEKITNLVLSVYMMINYQLKKLL